MNKLLNVLENIINAIGYFAAFLLVLMIANVFYDVVMRYVFNDVSIGMQELEWHLFSGMFMFGIGYTLKEDEHVRVDVFYERLSEKARAWINLLGGLIFTLSFAVIIVYYGSSYALDAYEMQEGSPDPGGLPHRWIVRSVIPLSSVYLLLCLLHVLITQVQIIVGKTSNSSETTKMGSL